MKKMQTRLAWLPACFMVALFFLAGSACGMRSEPVAPDGLPVNPAPAQITATLWRPAAGASWQWQLDDLPVDLSVQAEVYDIDLFDNNAGVVTELHERGRKVICYLSAGSWEDWRPDASSFPDEVIGKKYQGWPGERWLDIRRLDALGPIMESRLDLCREKGFDAVEPDNIDGYTNDTGFPLTYKDQLRYNAWLAQAAHARGLSIGLKNVPDQALDLLADFDWALVEDCFAEGWCSRMSPFIAVGKAVFAAEYTDTEIKIDEFCQQAQSLGLSAIVKNRRLDAYRQACP